MRNGSDILSEFNAVFPQAIDGHETSRIACCIGPLRLASTEGRNP